MDLKDVIKKPLVTEKSTQATSLGRYQFLVDRKANKREIKKAVEKFFEVQVKRVWTSMVQGKKKKASVQLAEGEKIDLFKSGE